jgi:integrase
MQKRRKKRKQSSPGITTRTLPSGQVRYQVYLGRDASGKQRFKNFADRNEAETHLEKHGIAKANEGQQLWSLTPDQRSEAVKCYRLLEPFKASLFDSTRFYVDHVLRFRNSPPVEELVKQLVERMGKNRRRPTAVEDVRVRLNKFGVSFRGRRLSDLTLEELRAWFDALHLSPRSVCHYMTKVSQLYRFAVRNNWCPENLVERLDRPSVEEGEAHIFPVDEARRLLEHADGYGLLPYVSIALFAGLRNAELQRLEWSAVKLSERSIVVGAKVAKKRGQRVVDINDTLASWLVPNIRSSGPVTPRGYRLLPRLEKLAKAVKVVWKKNGLRHSFCSYHLAMFGDSIQTAYQAGNSADMIHRHYKALVTKADAERFWALRPEVAEDGKVVPIQKAG